MDPIVLTKFGETLYCFGVNDKTGLSLSSSKACGAAVGIHYICDGTIRLIKVSGTHNVLHCDYCSLRVLIPVEVDNYGKLRVWFGADLTEEQRLEAFRTFEVCRKIVEAMVGRSKNKMVGTE